MAELLAANQITIAKVLDGADGEMSAEQLAQLNQASEDASQAKTDVANLEIGGRNYIPAVNSYSKTVNGITLDYDGEVYHIHGTNTKTDADYGIGGNFIEISNVFEPVAVYTVSTTTPLPSGLYLGINTRNSSGTGIQAASNAWLYGNGSKTSNTFTCTQNTNGTLIVFFGVKASCGTVDVTFKIKLEKGNKATDWTPAPEDVDAGIDNAAKVATNFLGYDSTNGLIIGNKTSGSWSGYRSQILPGSFNVLDPSSTVLASFGPTTVIGEEANANMHLTFNNLSMVDKNGTKFFEVGDNRNAEGIATIKHTAMVVANSTGSATVTVNSNISSIVSVYADSVQLSSSKYSFSGKTVTINGLTANSQTSIEITYTTTESTVYLTFGERDSSGNIGNYSVAEGYLTTASGSHSHAEGYLTKASGSHSHAEGWRATASGYVSHAEGYNTIASGDYSHAEGYMTTASGRVSHAGGYHTIADGIYMTAIGEYNTKNSGKAFVIGNGTSDTARSDAFTVDWNGNTVMKGGLTLGTPLSIASGGTGATSLAAAQENLGIKANSERIDNLILGTGTSPVEVQDARLSSDGTRYTTLKSRLDAENSELKSDLVEISEDVEVFKDGFEPLNLWSKTKKLYDDKYVYYVDGHVFYQENLYGIGSYILKVDANTKYTFSSPLRFCLPLKADKYTANSDGLLNDILSIDTSSYPTTEYITFSLQDEVTEINISKGDKAVAHGFRLPSWTEQIVKPKKEHTSIKRMSVLDSMQYIYTGDIICLRKNERIMFDAEPISFGVLEIGLTTSNNDSDKMNRVEINSTNIICYGRRNYADDSLYSDTVVHGLTLNGHIQVVLEQTEEDKITVTLSCKGQEFSHTFDWVKKRYGYAYAQAKWSIFSNATISWTCTDLDADIWCFGDSYIAYDTERWAYYLRENGYDKNVLFSGQPGCWSTIAITSFENLLKYGTPRYAVWAMGMNDGSDGDGASVQWSTSINEFLTICEDNGIMPILCTIPTVPTVNHEHKNYFVRNSGYRYIDFANGVNANSSGVWADGCLSADGVHPTVNGAKALYAKAITDFPELMIKY